MREVQNGYIVHSVKRRYLVQGKGVMKMAKNRLMTGNAGLQIFFFYLLTVQRVTVSLSASGTGEASTRYIS